MRADARRNRERLLGVAREAFAERGTEASLDDIARRAGVGIGTLYRHFPTRDALVAALIGDDLDALCALSDRLVGADDPFDALRTWLRAMVRHVGAFYGLAQSIVVAAGEESPLADGCHAMEAAAAAVFGRAQRLGHVRPDATAADAMDLAASIAWLTERMPDAGEGRADHLLDLALDGLRARKGISSSPGA